MPCFATCTTRAYLWENASPRGEEYQLISSDGKLKQERKRGKCKRNRKKGERRSKKQGKEKRKWEVKVK
jgi:hypothetical protein